MQAISLWQPWSSLMAHGLKRVETRSWAYRGQLPAVLAIHATAKVDEKLVAQLVNLPDDGDCPGEGQNPRNPETDRRPLWKDLARP